MNTTNLVAIVTMALLLTGCSTSSMPLTLSPSHPASVDADEAEGPPQSDTLALTEGTPKEEDEERNSQSAHGSHHHGHASHDEKHGGHHHGH